MLRLNVSGSFFCIVVKWTLLIFKLRYSGFMLVESASGLSVCS